MGGAFAIRFPRRLYVFKWPIEKLDKSPHLYTEGFLPMKSREQSDLFIFNGGTIDLFMTQGNLPTRLISPTPLKLVVFFFLGSRIVLMNSFRLQTEREY